MNWTSGARIVRVTVHNGVLPFVQSVAPRRGQVKRPKINTPPHGRVTIDSARRDGSVECKDSHSLI